MKKSILLITSFCVVALGILGYTFLYAGVGVKGDQECATACEKAHGGLFHDAAATAECPHAAKAANKPADGCCAAKGAEVTGTDAGKSSCPTFAKLKGGMSKEECAQFHATAKADAGAEKIEIK